MNASNFTPHATVRRHVPPALPHGCRGFSLIEIIVVILVIALLGTMMLPLTGAALRGSMESLVHTENETRLLRVAESMNARYRTIFMTEAAPLTAFSTLVGNVGHHTSANFGEEYTLIEKRFIQFNPTTRSEENGNNLLKLTLELDGTQITCLFGQ